MKSWMETFSKLYLELSGNKSKIIRWPLFSGNCIINAIYSNWKY